MISFYLSHLSQVENLNSFLIPVPMAQKLNPVSPSFSALMKIFSGHFELIFYCFRIGVWVGGGPFTLMVYLQSCFTLVLVFFLKPHPQFLPFICVVVQNLAFQISPSPVLQNYSTFPSNTSNKLPFS